MKELLKRVADRITPTAEEQKRENGIAKEIIGILGKYGVKPILVGSMAKGTDLRGDKDIDIFIAFPQSVGRDKLEKDGLSIGTAVFKKLKAEYEIDYAEHPYVKGVYRNYGIEIVPCYSGKKILSSVDRTPFHTQYVRRKLRDDKSLGGDIRLLKQFMKARGVYGAEAKVQGFSGYLTELLVIHYGSFRNVLKAVSKWKQEEVLDPENHWGQKEDLKYFFTNAELIVVDPIDKYRNVAAAVSREKLVGFIISAAEFLKNPKEEYFFPKEKEPRSAGELKKEVKSRGTRLYGIMFEHEKMGENSLYSQLRRTAKSLVKEIEHHGFGVFKSGFWTDEDKKSVVVLEFETWKLPDIEHHVGPPLDKYLEHQEEFREKHRRYKPYIKDGRWVVDKKREFKTVDKLSRKIFRERRGLGKNLRKSKLRLLKESEIFGIKDRDFLKFLDGFL